MNKLTIILFAALTTLSANAQLTPVQLDQYIDAMKQGCIARGHEREDKHAESFCGCVFDIMRANLSDDDFQEIASLAIAGQDPFGVPAFQALIPKIQSCNEQPTS